MYFNPDLVRWHKVHVCSYVKNTYVLFTIVSIDDKFSFSVHHLNSYISLSQVRIKLNFSLFLFSMLFFYWGGLLVLIPVGTNGDATEV